MDKLLFNGIKIESYLNVISLLNDKERSREKLFLSALKLAINVKYYVQIIIYIVSFTL